MRFGFLFMAISACIFLINGVVRAATPVFLEDTDGKSLVQMDDPALGNAYQEVSVGGKTVLYVHEGQILTDIHAAPILVVDDHSVRPTPAGVIIATFDNGNIRHGDTSDGKVLIYYHHPDLSPDFHADRIYRVNGPELNNTQLVAALYAIRPELFKLSDDEIASQKKAMAEAGAEADRLAAQDQIAKKWMVLNGHGPLEHIDAGAITFAAKQNSAYPTSFDYSKDGGPTFTGASAGVQISGDWTIFAAYGTPKTIGLCDYKIDGGKLSGTWHPWYDDGDAKNVGTEELTGPDTLDGDYQITSAKAPTTGAAYSGTVTIKPLIIVGADDEEKPYSITWTIGTVKIQGIGIRTKDHLYVSSGSGPDVMIGKFKIDNGSFNGDFFKLGSTDMGGLAATN
jgi:hypothetical protein